MIVYRIGSLKYASDLRGEGARLKSGRWNHKLTPCLYTAESRALSVLEYTVNINIDFIPRALSCTTFEIPDDEMEILKEKDLPGDWKQVPASASTKDFGTLLLKKQNSLIIKIPSIVIPHEHNFLINPSHPDIEKVRILDISDFVYDVRIKLT